MPSGQAAALAGSARRPGRFAGQSPFRAEVVAACAAERSDLSQGVGAVREEERDHVGAVAVVLVGVVTDVEAFRRRDLVVVEDVAVRVAPVARQAERAGPGGVRERASRTTRLGGGAARNRQLRSRWSRPSGKA